MVHNRTNRTYIPICHAGYLTVFVRAYKPGLSARGEALLREKAVKTVFESYTISQPLTNLFVGPAFISHTVRAKKYWPYFKVDRFKVTYRAQYKSCHLKLKIWQS